MQKKNLVDIFYHIRQVAARVANLVLGDAFGTSFKENGGRGSSAMVPLERTMWVSIGSLLWHCAPLSLTIRPKFTIECLRRSNQQKWVTFGQIWGGRGWPM